MLTVEERRAAYSAPEHYERVLNRGIAIKAAINQGNFDRLKKIAKNETTPKRKVIALYKLDNLLSEAAKGKSVCDNGCSHCCNMDVIISEAEASLIADITGKNMTAPLKYINETGYKQKYYGVACPFLELERCSIYEHRPHNCRNYISLEETGDMCAVVPGVFDLPVDYFDTGEFNQVYWDSLGVSAKRAADIRDFFP
ncbi:MAG: YkgJ family cysteine cluster protein [Candidatus Obscuribacterales bacterium]|nr:YkgJ family cysteine cluster protein [Candidatus Obscuribacterales bacterium]